MQVFRINEMTPSHEFLINNINTAWLINRYYKDRICLTWTLLAGHYGISLVIIKECLLASHIT